MLGPGILLGVYTFALWWFRDNMTQGHRHLPIVYEMLCDRIMKFCCNLVLAAALLSTTLCFLGMEPETTKVWIIYPAAITANFILFYMAVAVV
jgi:hypothetical protein